MANKKFIVKNGLNVTGDADVSGNIVVQGTITGDGSGLSGVTSYTQSNFDSDLASKSTDDLSEGSNQYFTTARARGAMVAGSGIVYDSATGVIAAAEEAAVDLFDSGDFDIAFAAKTTDDLTQGSTNLFYDSATTVTVARNSIVGGTGITYNAGTGSVAIGQAVGTSDDVTFNNITANDVTLGKLTADSAALTTIQFTAQPDRADVAGQLYWDSDEQKGLSFVTRTFEGALGATINVGQELLIYVHNQTGAQINNGQVVYISGTAHNLHPNVTLAQADVGAPGVFAVATMDIPDNTHGYVTRFGLVRGLNTGGLTAGASTYLSKDSAGEWTTTPVTVDNGYPAHIGTIVAVDSSEGTMLVDPWSENFEYLRIEDRLVVDGPIQAQGEVTANYLTLSGAAPSYAEGQLFYDSANGALAFHNDEADLTLQIGQEQIIKVYNDTGSTIADGKPVYYSGQHSGTPTIALADATDTNKYNVRGLTTHSIENGTYGYVTLRGRVNDLNTSSLSAGQNVFLGLTPGDLTNTSPSVPNYPMCIGYVATSDSSEGIIIVDTQDHTVNSFRVINDAYVGNDLTVAGDLTVLGTQTIASSENISIGGAFNYFNAGDTIGVANTTFTGSGLDDGTLTGHYEGTATNKGFYVEIDATGTPDTFKWSHDSDFSVSTNGVAITGSDQALADGISIQFDATTGHTLGDKWSGTASPINVDTGWFSNRNTGASGIGYSHVGVFFDVSDTKFVALSAYDPEPTGTIDLSDSSTTYATFKAGTFEGNLSGNVTGNADTATLLDNTRTIGISGDITATGVGFNGGSNITLSANIAAGAIVNADINASAAIADTKLATISTAGKVQNSATTATSANTASAIVARDGSGNFTAGTMTGNVNRSASTSVAAGTYGSAALVPVVTVDANGFVDSIGEVSVAGVSGTSFDSSTGAYTISTADGGSFETRVHSRELARAAVSVTDAGGDGSLAYNSSTGVITYTGPSATEVRAHLSAGTGLSFSSGEYSISNSGVSAATYGDSSTIPVISVNAQGQITAVVGAGVNIPAGYGQSEFDTDFGEKDTDDLSEGTSNLYHTTSRARSAISVTDAGGDGSLAYNSGTGVITYTGPSAAEVRAHFSASTGISISSGAISNTGVTSVNSVTGAVTAANLLTAIKTVDGATSGLDADLLDGQHGSYYRIDVYNAAGTLLN